MARKDSGTKERLVCVCVCVCVNIKDILTHLGIINEVKNKIKHKRNLPCTDISKKKPKRQKEASCLCYQFFQSDADFLKNLILEYDTW